MREGINPTLAEEKLLGFAIQAIPSFDPGPRGTKSPSSPSSSAHRQAAA